MSRSEELVNEIHVLWETMIESYSMEDFQVERDGRKGILTLLTSVEGATIGIDGSSRFHLFLGIKGKEEINSRLTSGIIISTKKYEGLADADLHAGIIADPRWRLPMIPFAADAMDRMKDGAIEISELKNLVEEYRALWAEPKEPLTRTEQRGLIAELHAVDRIGELTGYAQTVSKWTGPYRELHDISDEEFSVEVKSYSDEPPRVRINHIEQLDYRMEKRLTLLGVHIVRNDEGMTLPEFVDQALGSADEAGCRSAMEERLNLAGWRAEEREEYVSKFHVGRCVICPIRPDSPIFPPQIHGRLPASVTNVAYSLHLNDIKQLSSKNEEAWRSMLGGGAWPALEGELTPDELLSTECSKMLSTDSSKMAKLPESQHLEFKSSTWHSYQESSIPPEHMKKKLESVIVKSVSALLNSEGGCLLIGVSDDNEILGLSNDLETRGLSDYDQYENTIVQILSSSIGKPSIASCVRVSMPELDGKTICRIEVKPSPIPVFTSDETFYVRNNNATHQLSPSEAMSYYSEHWRIW